MQDAIQSPLNTFMYWIANHRNPILLFQALRMPILEYQKVSAILSVRQSSDLVSISHLFSREGIVGCQNSCIREKHQESPLANQNVRTNGLHQLSSCSSKRVAELHMLRQAEPFPTKAQSLSGYSSGYIIFTLAVSGKQWDEKAQLSTVCVVALLVPWLI